MINRDAEFFKKNLCSILTRNILTYQTLHGEALDRGYESNEVDKVLLNLDPIVTIESLDKVKLENLKTLKKELDSQTDVIVKFLQQT